MRAFLVGSALVFQIIYTTILYLAASYSLFIIAKRNGVGGKYLAFIPVFQFYIIGSLCEEYLLMGHRIRHLQWVVVFLELLQIYLSFFSGFFFAPVRLVVNAFTALILHKFFYLFVPQRATLYALLAMFGRLPLVILLFVMKDKPMQMSAGAYPYPFGKRY